MEGIAQQSDEQGEVGRWRLSTLIEAGYPQPLAAELAYSEVDLHEAVDLLARGCDPETAAAILL